GPYGLFPFFVPLIPPLPPHTHPFPEPIFPHVYGLRHGPNSTFLLSTMDELTSQLPKWPRITPANVMYPLATGAVPPCSHYGCPRIAAYWPQPSQFHTHFLF